VNVSRLSIVGGTGNPDIFKTDSQATMPGPVAVNGHHACTVAMLHASRHEGHLLPLNKSRGDASRITLDTPRTGKDRLARRRWQHVLQPIQTSWIDEANVL
jgi:hypothetical protein